MSERVRLVNAVRMLSVYDGSVTNSQMASRLGNRAEENAVKLFFFAGQK